MEETIVISLFSSKSDRYLLLEFSPEYGVGNHETAQSMFLIGGPYHGKPASTPVRSCIIRPPNGRKRGL